MIARHSPVHSYGDPLEELVDFSLPDSWARRYPRDLRSAPLVS